MKKETLYSITTRISQDERAQLLAVAQNQDIPYGNILRQLIRYILRREIGWVELFEKTNDDALKDKASVTIRAKLPGETYIAFSELAEKMGSTASIILRRLVLLYVNNKVDWKTVWATQQEQNTPDPAPVIILTGTGVTAAQGNGASGAAADRLRALIQSREQRTSYMGRK